MKEFKSTYLCIKQHDLTGLKYLCKTTGTEEYLLKKYKGSGTYWKDHLRIHGRKYVETIWYCLFTEKDELIRFALMCSNQWDIVNSKDANGKKIWANLIAENGLDGGTYRTQSMDTRNKKANSMLGKNKDRKLGAQSEEHKANRSISMLGKNTGPQSAEHIANHAAAVRGKNKDKTQQKVTCPYCLKEGGICSMKRWHFDRCKNKC